MANTIEQIDNYLKKNKKPLFTNLNKWFGEKKSNGSFVLDDDAKNLKSLWEDAQNAKGINNKIEAFNKLKEELGHWSNPEELAKQEAELEEYGLDNWPELQDKLNMDQMRFFDQLSNMPEVSKLDDLNIDDIYSNGYDFEQMKALADQYGYDYADKADRKEFLDKVYDYHKAKNVDEAFKANDLRGAATDFILPISKEYARQNYDNIRTDSKWNSTKDMAVPLAADAITNFAMMGTPGKVVSNPTAKMVANNITAPVIREAVQMGLNDKSLQDAAVDAAGAVATNYATPYALRIPMRWAGRVTQGEVKQGAQDMINAAANKARKISDKVMDGTPIVHIVEKSDGTKTPQYFIFNKDSGKLERVADHIARKAKNGETVTWKDYKEWKDIGYTNRGANVHKLPEKLRESDEQKIRDQMRTGATKATQNDIEGKPWNSGLNAVEAAGAAGIDPIETKWNFVKSSPIANDIQNYITNFQGQSRYATPMLNAGTQVLGPAGEYLKIEKKKTLSDTDKKELSMLERLRDLHMKNPKLFGMPKLPDKFKDYVNPEDWNDEQLTIKGIFGGN